LGGGVLGAELGDGGGGQLIAALVPLVTGVALEPLPVDFMAAGEDVQFTPEILIFDGIAFLGAPTASTPVLDPGGDALAKVIGVGEHLDEAGAVKGLEPLDRRLKFHAVVGRRGYSSGEFPSLVLVHDDTRPGAGAGISLAAAVGVDDDLRL